MNCPYHGGECGLDRDVALIIAQRRAQMRQGGRRALEMATYTGANAETLTRVDPVGTTTYKQPARSPSVESDVKVPAFQSLLTGGLFGVGALGFALLTDKSQPFAVGFAGAFVGTALDWVLGRFELRRLLWTIESWTNTDIDDDGHKGKPPEPESSRWWSINGDVRPLTENDKKYAAFLRFARLVEDAQNNGKRAGQKALRGKPLGYHYKVTDDLHREFFQKLIDNGLAEMTGNGPRLTATRREILATIQPPPQG